MSSGIAFRLRQKLKGSLWLVPLIAIFVGAGLAQLDIAIEPYVDLPPSWQYTEATASAVLSAILAAMVGLTGIVVAVGVLIVQMATGTLSARYMRLWYRDPLQKAVLGAFVGTMAFAYALLRRVGQTVPDVGVTFAGVAVAASVVLFLLYLDRFVHRLRPVAVAALVAEAGKKVFSALPPPPDGDPAAMVADRTLELRPDDAPLVVRADRAGVIQAIALRRLLDAPTRHDGVFVLPCSVGDFVPRRATLVEVHAAASAPPPRRLAGMFALGNERTIEQDPAFALRIIVDIAIRALSPAVNDPTTAVQLLDRIEDLLQLIGENPLEGRGQLRDDAGRIRLIAPSRSWDDYLALGVTEIIEYGAAAPQVTRRLRAVLDSLMASVLPEHRAAVETQIAALDAALERIGDPVKRAFAAQPDRQGIGGARSDRDRRFIRIG